MIDYKEKHEELLKKVNSLTEEKKEATIEDVRDAVCGFLNNRIDNESWCNKSVKVLDGYEIEFCFDCASRTFTKAIANLFLKVEDFEDAFIEFRPNSNIGIIIPIHSYCQEFIEHLNKG